MMRQASGSILFGAGAALMALAVILGKFFLSDLHQLGMIGYEAAYGPRGMLLFLLFALGFPFGAGLAVLGMLVRAGAPGGRVALFAAAAVLGAFGSVIVPLVFGTHISPAYFGTGGVLILLLALATAWAWGGRRAQLAAAGAPTAGADLQALGYLCFALAAWNLCGVGGMPGFALYPEKMLALDARDFAVGQMKAVMAFFVLGWFFTALGWWRRQV